MALLLFDIDGTLIHSGGMGRRAFEGAVRDLYGTLPSEPFPYDGMLDTQVAAKTLDLLGRDCGREASDRLIARYLELLVAERPAVPGAHLCPGFPGLLDEALKRGHRLGLLTGNVEPGARLKLGFVGLDAHFRWNGGLLGAFGGDAQERAGLVGVALARCGAAYDRVFEAAETWLVGDSARDVEAAKAAGARSAAVATGSTPLEALAALGPDLVLPDLGEPRLLWQAIEGGPVP